MTPSPTERLILRAWTPDDAPAVLEIYRHAEVYRYLAPGSRPMQTLADAEMGLRRRMDRTAELGFGLWAVECRQSGEVLGACGLNRLDETGEIEVAYHFRPDAWGRGIASEAARQCVEHGLTTLGLDVIVGITHPENVASQRVLKKAGLTYTGPATYFGIPVERFERRRDARHVSMGD
ncbi:MAG: GNAT family N-acetyltransferase [Fimbriimonadaceae bacterium]